MPMVPEIKVEPRIRLETAVWDRQNEVQFDTELNLLGRYDE